MKIHKEIILARNGVVELNLPKRSVVISAQMQRGDLCVWYEFDENFNAGLEWIKIVVLGTGISLDSHFDHIVHIDTVQDGGFVWHVFRIMD